MALEHARPGQAVDVRPLASSLASSTTTALFKGRDLEVMRLVLPAGKTLPPHKVPGEIAIQCIEGAIDVTCDGQSHVVRAGHLLYLPRDAVHGVTALEDASALVTIALRAAR
jgi:quercetin dioxygenase-like cupin family protein